jgi:hypothetical protein
MLLQENHRETGSCGKSSRVGSRFGETRDPYNPARLCFIYCLYHYKITGLEERRSPGMAPDAKKLFSYNTSTKFNLKIGGMSNGTLGQSAKTRI